MNSSRSDGARCANSWFKWGHRCVSRSHCCVFLDAVNTRCSLCQSRRGLSITHKLMEIYVEQTETNRSSEKHYWMDEFSLSRSRCSKNFKRSGPLWGDWSLFATIGSGNFPWGPNSPKSRRTFLALLSPDAVTPIYACIDFDETWLSNGCFEKRR
jgi:hypothetical protein